MAAVTVSIPFTSGNSFLHFWLLLYLEQRSCVNPLHIGELISTHRMVTCVSNSYMCQSPSRRGTHFYLCTHAHIDHCGGCVNPLHVGKLISTWSRRNGKDTSLVSIPFTSGNSFLQKENVKGILTKKSVNPLHVGELISTLHYYLIAWSPLCVNPLHVGELISTKQTRPSHGCIKCVNPLHVGELISTYQSSLQGSKG